MTFRKKEQWISEIDLYIVSTSLIPYIALFQIDKDLSLPSHHTIINVEINTQFICDTKILLKRSEDLIENEETS